ncbi:MAG: PDZ domain-containing protein [Phototrophicaceae bacterium]
MRKKLLLIKIVLALASLGIVASLFAQDTVTATTEQTFLGVGLAESNNQVVISRVMNASPADQAGLLIGDVITSVNGTAVTTATEVSDLVLALAAGDVVTLEIERQGEVQTVEATLVSLPVSAMGGRHGNHGGFGGRGGDMNDDMDDMFGWHFGNGMPFAEGEIFAMPIPADQTMAEMLLGADLTETDAGQEVVSIWDNHLGLELQVGDIITSVNGVAVAELDLNALHTELFNMDTPTLTIEITRAGDPMTLTATLPMMMESGKMGGGRGGNFLFGFGMGGRHGDHHNGTATPAPEATEVATATPNA